MDCSPTGRFGSCAVDSTDVLVTAERAETGPVSLDGGTMLPLVTGVDDAFVQVLGALQGILVTVFLVATMMAVGLQLTRGDVVETVRSYNLLARWLLANVVSVPLFALVLAFLFDLPDAVQTALFLVAVAPGAPFIPRLVGLAGLESGRAVQLTAALTVVAAVLAPVLATAAIVVFQARRAPVLQFLVPLILVLVVPLALGTALRDRAPDLAARLTAPLARVANLSLFGALIVIVVLDPGSTARILAGLFGTGVLFVLLAFVLGTIAIGWLLGGPAAEGRRVLALAAAARNIGIALFIVTSAFPESNADEAIVAFTVFMFVVSGGVAFYWGRTAHTAAAAT